MFKHKDTPDRNRKVSGSLSSGSMDSSETASLDSNMEEQQKAAREVWDRHTNPGSELSMAKRRMMVEREVQSRAAKGGNAGVVRRLEEAGPKHLVKTSIVDRDVVYEDMKKVPTVTKPPTTELPSKSLKVTERKVFGLDKNQVLVLVIVLLVSLILYSVLLHLTVKAALCQDTLETIMMQRRDWQTRRCFNIT